MKKRFAEAITDFRYKEQQCFLDELARKLSVVCFRPDYHGEDRDKNTVLFYTKEDAAHNTEVDKQPFQYSRGQASDLRFCDEKYIYRDHFWAFENTDLNGHLDYGFANFGRLDLRGLRWRDAIEGSIKLALVKKKQNVYIAASGGILGLRESDETNNDMNREIIEAVKLRYGKAFLGSVNLYGEQRERVASGEESPLEEYGRQKLYNFCADFVVPNDDMELAAMIRRWNGGGESELVGRIVNRVQELGGVNLIWY